MAIYRKATEAGINREKAEVEKQMELCEAYLEYSSGVTALIPESLLKLETYLPMLEQAEKLDKPNAKRWFEEGQRLACICRGPLDDLAQYCSRMLKHYQ